MRQYILIKDVRIFNGNTDAFKHCETIEQYIEAAKANTDVMFTKGTKFYESELFEDDNPFLYPADYNFSKLYNGQILGEEVHNTTATSLMAAWKGQLDIFAILLKNAEFVTQRKKSKKSVERSFFTFKIRSEIEYLNRMGKDLQIKLSYLEQQEARITS